MKSLFSFFTLGLCLFLSAQEIQVDSNLPYEADIESYHVRLVLDLEKAYDYSNEYHSLDELKAGYWKALQKEGVSSRADLVKSDMPHSSFVKKNSAYYEFSSPKKEDILALQQTYFPMAEIEEVMGILRVTDTAYQKIYEKALKDVKQKAEKIASSSGLSLGKIKKIEANNPYTTNKQPITLNAFDSLSFTLSVTFEAN